DKTPLPRAQNTLTPAEPRATVDEEKSAAVLHNFTAPALLFKTPAALIGGLGLFLAFIGWHRLRSFKK
ncbi:MAG TPA: hypothetical protein VD861_09975, partial [Pyrinomonadaceae bacterium]|nr:hypothetical protein [Pyrinomonadaceae bacterium]